MAAEVKPSPGLRGKRNSRLQNLGKMLKGNEISGLVKVMDHTFHLQTLNYDEETWADQYVLMGSPVQTVKTRRLPYISAAIKSITFPDGVIVEKKDLFDLPDDMDEDIKKIITSDPVELEYWLNRQMMLFLGEEGNSPFITPIWNKLDEMITKRQEALESISNLSKDQEKIEDTSSGMSKVSSSLEKESSSQIQPSPA